MSAPTIGVHFTIDELYRLMSAKKVIDSHCEDGYFTEQESDEFDVVFDKVREAHTIARGWGWDAL